MLPPLTARALARRAQACSGSVATSVRRASTLSSFKIPSIANEPNQHYAPGSTERHGLEAAIRRLGGQIPLQVPVVVNGQEMRTSSVATQPDPSRHASIVAEYCKASPKDVLTAIESALAAKASWEATPFADRAAIFLKAADLLSKKYRYDIMAATMLSQGKNAWQAEIDSAAELIDFLRFNVQYAEEVYAQQPEHHAPGVWNRLEYRPLEGFVYAVTPFNFTAIAGNLPCAPALMGNVVVWKPSDSAMASNWLLYRVLLEAGLPKDVIQFVPGDPQEVTDVCLSHKQLGALHYTGSTDVFRKLYGTIGQGIAEGRYVGYPRIVGETGGKNFHLVHASADVENAVIHTVRGAFEYAGQKCSATSRLYVPRSLWPAFKTRLVALTVQLRLGPVQDFAHHVGPVIHQRTFDKLAGVIDAAKSDPGLTLLAGGTHDASVGYYIRPTIYEVAEATHELMSRELFGPILTAYVYDDAAPPASASTTAGSGSASAFEAICSTIDTTSPYALTGAVFARDRAAVRAAEERLRHAAGNFYINCKSTGAVVGQQPFGGARASGTNDKAGWKGLLARFVSVRSVKEEFLPLGGGELLLPSGKGEGRGEEGPEAEAVGGKSLRHIGYPSND